VSPDTVEVRATNLEEPGEITMTNKTQRRRVSAASRGYTQLEGLQSLSDTAQTRLSAIQR
jgi:hypothetical protein